MPYQLSHFLLLKDRHMSGQVFHPAMQAGLTKKSMTIEDIANLVVIEAPKKRGSYKKM
jgi:hypothetical protein